MLQTYQKSLVGKRIGVVFGSFAPLHTGHLDLIYRAKKECDGCIVVVCGFDGDKGEPVLPHSKRYRYAREYFENDDQVAVYAINDTELGLDKYPNGWTGWLQEFERIWFEEARVNPGASRVWYVGDQVYYDDLVALHEEVYLMDRKGSNPICATAIREDPIGNWESIAWSFRRAFSHNILVCGTASEGKTTLVQDLGKYFGTAYSWEWPRDFLIDTSMNEWELGCSDYLTFLTGQYQLNRKLIASKENRGVFFADSDSMVTRMYAEYFAREDPVRLPADSLKLVTAVADEFTCKSRWNKIFLVAPHGKFVDDHMRYMAHSSMAVREEMFRILCDNIRASGNWDKVCILRGSYYENFLTVQDYVRKEVLCCGEHGLGNGCSGRG